MKRIVKFKDKEGNLATIEISLNEGRFSMSGQHGGGCGQCQDSIKPKNEAQKKLIDIWEKYHLNDIHAGTKKQEKAIEKCKSKDYNTQIKFLKSQKLYIDEGYKYGSGWLTRGLPKGLWHEVERICKSIKAIEKKEKESLTVATWEEVGDDCIIALAQHLKITPQEAIRNISGQDNAYIYAGIDYFVGTENEARKIALSYITEEPETWMHAVGAGQTEKGLKDWAEEVIDIDGIGHILNGWDGSEYEQEVNGTVYTVCRR